MKTWIIYAIVSMLFAGFTSVVAKKGLTGISGELGLVIRTVFVFLFVLGFAALVVPFRALESVRKDNLYWLALSGVTTSVSWVFYYKALKEGEVSIIALIDKGSILVAILLATLFLKEVITLRTILGGILIFAGIFVIAKK